MRKLQRNCTIFGWRRLKDGHAETPNYITAVLLFNGIALNMD